MAVIKGHKISWFVYAGTERIPSQKSMRGTWGYDAVCECGWDSQTGGATATSVGRMVTDHKWEVSTPELSAEEVGPVKVTVVVVNGDPEVHAAGCADLKKGRKVRVDVKYDLTVSSRQEVANDFWADFIDEESMTAEEALGYTQFYPCCGLK